MCDIYIYMYVCMHMVASFWDSGLVRVAGLHNAVPILGMGSITQKYIEIIRNSNGSLIQTRIPKGPRVWVQDIAFVCMSLHNNTSQTQDGSKQI